MTTVAPSTRKRTSFVYSFDQPAPGGRELLGGKGLGLSEMAHLGVPVPAGFTITTDACRAFLRSGGDLPAGLEDEIAEHIERLELVTGATFGDPSNPLLVSVRSGAAISMPGMMDSILDLGLNDEAVQGLAAATGSARFAYDSYRRLIQMYGEVVDGIDSHRFEQARSRRSGRSAASRTTSTSTASDLMLLIERYKQIYDAEAGHAFPEDAHEQLMRAVRAVFDSWNSPRARVYRHTYEIPEDLGTAVNVMQMVFGNKGDDCGTGVCFSRDPSTGERGICGEFLLNAQGEDVVAGIRHPVPLEELRAFFPAAFDQLEQTVERLERHYRDVQDIEFTVEQGRLYLLQTRSAKRTAAAAVKAAVAMVEEGLLSRDEAIGRIDPAQLDHLLHPTLDRRASYEVVASGLAASPGAASATPSSTRTPPKRAGVGEDVILVRWETSPDDIHGLIAAKGILTAHGGIASHAALVARGMGKPCVAGCGDLTIDLERRVATIGGHRSPRAT